MRIRNACKRSLFITLLASNIASPAHALNAKIDRNTEALLRQTDTTAEVLQSAPGARPASKVEAFVSDSRRSKLFVPYFFQMPRTEFSPLPESVVNNSSNLLVVDQLRLDYPRNPQTGRRAAAVPALQSLVGLRWTVVNQSKDSAGRLKAATTLGSSGMVQTGDVILSFRPEWYASLPYSHLQLGVSHTGVALLTPNNDGSQTLHNVDMPLDSETWGGASNDFLNSKHYVEAPYLHIVRPIALHDGVNDEQERQNVEQWLLLLRKNASKFYKNPLSFNSDYMTSNYKTDSDGNADLTFVADLARLSLGGRIQGRYGSKGYSMYCSEFAWAVLSLRECDPNVEKDAFLRGETPSCVKEIMPAMPILGNYQTAFSLPDGSKKTLDGAPLEVGLADGAMMIADVMTRDDKTPARRNKFIRGTFITATGKPEHISSGHLAVQKGILAKNPKFFDLLAGYFSLAGDIRYMNPMSLTSADQAKLQQVVGLQLGFNERMELDRNGSPVLENGRPVLKAGPLNYSPTAFLVHALLPRGEKLKAFSYVTSVTFIPAEQIRALESQLSNSN